MLEHVRELVDQQYITAGSVYSILEERIQKLLRVFRWDTPEELQQKVQAAFPIDTVKTTMREVYVIRQRMPTFGMFKFYL